VWSSSMGNLTELQRKILECAVFLYRAYGRPIKSGKIASHLNIHPGTVRNAISTLKVLGLVESKRGPLGGYTPTERALSIYTKRDTPSAALLAVDGKPTRVSTTLTLCLTEKALTLELRNLGKRMLWISGKRVVIRLGEFIIDGEIVVADRALRKAVVTVKRVVKASRPVKVQPDMSIREVLKLMSKRGAECALLVRGKKIVGYVNIRKIVEGVARGVHSEAPVESISKSVPRSKDPLSKNLLKLLRLGYCMF